MYSVGIDICTISKMERIVGDSPKFPSRYFTALENEYLDKKGKAYYHSLAGMFAAKEAFIKAMNLGISILNFSDIEILHKQSGQPYMQLHGKAKQCFEEKALTSIHLSISHDSDYAVALVMVE